MMTSSGEELDLGAPEEAGLSSVALQRLEQVLHADVEKGAIGGAVALIARRNKVVYFKSLGRLDAAGVPMSNDAIFRIYSMTKPLTTIAVMRLFEEGRIRLDDPLSNYLPELGGLKVVTDQVDPSTGRVEVLTVPAEREITIYDLLLHTSGFGGGVSGSPIVSKLYAEAGIIPYDHTAKAFQETSQDLIEKLGQLPLAHQPGHAWEYSRSGDVLGRVVEVVTGTSIDKVIETWITGPLGMNDTGFYVDERDLPRLVQPHTPPGATDRQIVNITSPPKFLSGGSGGYSSARDYLRFARMLLNGGKLEGVRILGRKTVELMTADHLGPLSGSGPDYIPGPGYGFGLGFAVRKEAGRSVFPGSVGDYWWLGRAGTSFFIDPREELIGILMLQIYGRARYYQALFKTLVCQAISD